MTLRVVIDTDPGLDDAVGILYALAEPRFAVEAITTVAGNIGLETTTANAGRLLAVMGRDTPYVAGAARPLAREGVNEEAIHGADGLGGVALPAPLAAPLEAHAVAYLAERLLAEPEGALTLLALAPLTNLALLARDHPEAYRRIARVIAMGGTIHEAGNMGPHAEFNLASDPDAAALVFAQSVPVTLIPLDVTRKFRASPADLATLGASEAPAAQVSKALIEAYFAGSARESRPLHDPCVMLLALDPALFTTETMRLRVDCGAEPGRLIADDAAPAIEVAMGIDAPAALARLWAGLQGKAGA